MENLMIDTGMVRQLAQEIRDQNQTFKGYVDSLGVEKDNLGNAWHGENATSYRAAISQQIERLNQLSNTFNEIGGALDEIATGFDRLEQNTTLSGF